MKHAILLLLALNLCGCAGIKQAQQARRVAKAHAVLACYGADTPADQQLSDLLAAHPALQGQTVRLVTERDTVHIAEATATVSLPAVSTTASDNALIDSLLNSTGRQLRAKDSALFASRLRAELSRRPRLSRDTVTRIIGPITLRLWTDAHGRPQAVVVKAAQAVAYEKTVTETGPVLVKPEARPWYEDAWLWIRNALGVLIGAFALICGVWIFFAFRRAQQA